MQNIQDLQEKIFFESKNIISILDKINNVDELLSKQDLIDELADRISFLKLLKKKLDYYKNEDSPFLSPQMSHSFMNSSSETKSFSDEVTEEEAIFNNELNEIGENHYSENHNSKGIIEEEAIFNNQLNEIEENEFYENKVSLTEEESAPENSYVSAEENTEQQNLNEITEEESIFSNQLNEIDEETSEKPDAVLSFVDEERILENAEPENEETIDEEIFEQKVTEEEAIFNNQLNEIDEFESQIADGRISDSFDEKETSHNIFDTEGIDDEILIEESEYHYVSQEFKANQNEIINENEEIAVKTDDSDRRKIVDINKPSSDKEKETLASDESFENLEAYHQEKRIKLANIKGLKNIQTLFDDDPLEREIPQKKPLNVAKEEFVSLQKSNIPTDYMEAEKQKQEFRLDLNDRMAFTKMLFAGSQTDLNNAVSDLNRCRNQQEAKEYLSELYYKRKWSKADEYAQRLWILVENKFL